MSNNNIGINTIFSTDSPVGDLSITNHDENHIFVHTDFISSQLNPKALSASLVFLEDKSFIQLEDTGTGFKQVIPIADSGDEFVEFFTDNYGLSPKSVSKLNITAPNTTPALTLDCVDERNKLEIFIVNNLSVVIKVGDFFAQYPLDHIGIRASEFKLGNNPNDDRIELSFLTRLGGCSYANYLIKLGSYEQIQNLFRELRFPMPEERFHFPSTDNEV